MTRAALILAALLLLALAPAVAHAQAPERTALADRVLVAMIDLQEPGRSLESLTAVAEGAEPACTDRASLMCAAPRFDRRMRAWVRPETYDEGMVRYRRIAEATAAVACRDEPRCHAEPSATALDRAAKIIATGYHEGQWLESIHAGRVRGDGGRSVCFMQILTQGPGPRHIPWLAMVLGQPERLLASELEGTGPEATALCVAAGMLALEKTGVVLYTGASTPETRRRLGTYWRALGLLRSVSRNPATPRAPSHRLASSAS